MSEEQQTEYLNPETQPLVTLSVFAYNQEKYIRKAVEGAFAQTYEPLEIILSDDCSTDQTFEIMEEMASVYKGPHKVRVFKQTENLGTLDHIIVVSRVSKGLLFIVNAGDDFSYPDRATELVNAWKQTKAAALSSLHDEIDENGELLSKNQSFPPSQATQIIFGKSKIALRIDGLVQSIPGFAAAYSIEFLKPLTLNNKKILIEDGVFGALINIRGEKIYRVQKSLISYRQLPNSLSVRDPSPSKIEVLQREKK